jgi:hypothetical protein
MMSHIHLGSPVHCSWRLMVVPPTQFDAAEHNLKQSVREVHEVQPRHEVPTPCVRASELFRGSSWRLGFLEMVFRCSPPKTS